MTTTDDRSYATARFIPERPAYTSRQVCDLTGATYRQLDHWCSLGLVADTAQGSGTQRRFAPAQLDTVYAAVALINHGFGLDAAFLIAAQLIAEDHYSARIADIFELTITVRDTSSPVEKPEPPSTEETSA